MKTLSIACIIVFVLAAFCKNEDSAASTGIFKRPFFKRQTFYRETKFIRNSLIISAKIAPLSRLTRSLSATISVLHCITER